jgi:hypothetical protein
MVNTIHQHESWQIRPNPEGPDYYCAACGADVSASFAAGLAVKS